MKRLAVALALGIITLAGAAFLLFGDRGGIESADLPMPPSVPAAAVADLYALSLPDLEGRIQPLAQWRGQVLVVNYWASWCLPCRKEMPMLSALQTRLAEHGVRVVGIAADSSDQVAAFAREMPVAYPLLIGGPDAIRPTLDFGNIPQAVPFTLVIDRSGKVHAAVLGTVHEDALERLLAKLI